MYLFIFNLIFSNIQLLESPGLWVFPIWGVFNQYFSLRPPVPPCRTLMAWTGDLWFSSQRPPRLFWFQVSAAAQGAQSPLTCPLVTCSPVTACATELGHPASYFRYNVFRFTNFYFILFNFFFAEVFHLFICLKKNEWWLLKGFCDGCFKSVSSTSRLCLLVPAGAGLQAWGPALWPPAHRGGCGDALTFEELIPAAVGSALASRAGCRSDDMSLFRATVAPAPCRARWGPALSLLCCL